MELLRDALVGDADLVQVPSTSTPPTPPPGDRCLSPSGPRCRPKRSGSCPTASSGDLPQLAGDDHRPHPMDRTKPTGPTSPPASPGSVPPACRHHRDDRQRGCCHGNTRRVVADPAGDLDNGLRDLSNRLDSTEESLDPRLRCWAAPSPSCRIKSPRGRPRTRATHSRGASPVEPPPTTGPNSSSGSTSCAATTRRCLTSPSSRVGLAHPGIVEDVAGVHHAWKIAVIDDQIGRKIGGNNLTAWHDRWLWPFLRRLKTGHYRTTNCRSDHHEPERLNVAPTDRQLLPSVTA